ncbi:hypothetical protein P4O66_002848 [Electrophorus voltai]|uniref:IRS-type PTB domain-containing protein n=1 Tax=Electrophorus voltai TaxID=2609070 RepID=A0AAD9DLV2_9TELE|nr:hypothetical protein P4O66_002848 [Electrophorus voltai]
MRRNLPALQYKVHDSAFCRVLSADTTAAAIAAAAVCSGGVDRDIWKCGHLRKQKHGHKRFFVLRGPSNLGPSRLEYYDINKRADAKNKYLIALYTKDEYFAMVADSEQEQEDWYLALTELMTEGKKGQLDTDELDDGYGTISPGTIFKEVWQTIHLVKLNSETPAVNLPLMNIRRCGHSESFFFIEVGRSSSIGPDFRPRSKSQSSGTNPIPFITTRRHFGNLPPSQTGLQRPSRTDSVTDTPPTGKGSLVHLNTPCLNVGREESSGCCAHASPGYAHHTRSASLPVSHFLYFRASSSTPESHGNTPPVREEYRLVDYMAMDWHKDSQGGPRTFEEESSYMERTFLKLAHSSKPKPGNGLGVMQQKATQTSSSLDESSPVESKRPPSLNSDGQKKLPKDEGYMPMMYSMLPTPNADYTPMQPRANHPATLDIHPCASQQVDTLGYMVMLPGDSPSPGLSSPSGINQPEYDDYMDMSRTAATDVYSQASPEGRRSRGSYFSLPRSYKAPSRENCEQREYIATSPADPPSPPSLGEYIHMDFGERHPLAASSPSAADTPLVTNAQPCYQLCCSSPEHAYLGLNMDSLLKDRPPRHSLVAPWNPPNYARPLACAYGQAQTEFDPEKIRGGCRGAESPLPMMQHLCISERPPSPQMEPRVVRADPQGRRRHSSETFGSSPGSSANVCGVRASANLGLAESGRWQNSASFDSVWSHTDDQGSPDPVVLPANCVTGGNHRNASSSYLNYIALDLRDVPRNTRNAPPPHPARGTLQESEAYAGIDFSMSGGHTTASKARQWKLIHADRPSGIADQDTIPRFSSPALLLLVVVGGSFACWYVVLGVDLRHLCNLDQ